MFDILQRKVGIWKRCINLYYQQCSWRLAWSSTKLGRLWCLTKLHSVGPPVCSICPSSFKHHGSKEKKETFTGVDVFSCIAGWLCLVSPFGVDREGVFSGSYKSCVSWGLYFLHFNMNTYTWKNMSYNIAPSDKISAGNSIIFFVAKAVKNIIQWQQKWIFNYKDR